MLILPPVKTHTMFTALRYVLQRLPSFDVKHCNDHTFTVSLVISNRTLKVVFVPRLIHIKTRPYISLVTVATGTVLYKKPEVKGSEDSRKRKRLNAGNLT